MTAAEYGNFDKAMQLADQAKSLGAPQRNLAKATGYIKSIAPPGTLEQLAPKRPPSVGTATHTFQVSVADGAQPEPLAVLSAAGQATAVAGIGAMVTGSAAAEPAGPAIAIGSSPGGCADAGVDAGKTKTAGSHVQPSAALAAGTSRRLLAAGSGSSAVVVAAAPVIAAPISQVSSTPRHPAESATAVSGAAAAGQPALPPHRMPTCDTCTQNFQDGEWVLICSMCHMRHCNACGRTSSHVAYPFVCPVCIIINTCLF